MTEELVRTDINSDNDMVDVIVDVAMENDLTGEQVEQVRQAVNHLTEQDTTEDDPHVVAYLEVTDTRAIIHMDTIVADVMQQFPAEPTEEPMTEPRELIPTVQQPEPTPRELTQGQISNAVESFYNRRQNDYWAGV